MSDIAYNSLARYYDKFTLDVPYEKFADFYEQIFREHGLKPQLVLDLACGTGTLTWLMAGRGYEMIGTDQSSEMLTQAYSKFYPDYLTEEEMEKCISPVFLNQSMTELDLYGTIEACICSLDSVNYVTDINDLDRAFSLVSLFTEPGGIFIFDVNTPEKLEGLDQTAYTRECDEAFCVYQADYSFEEKLLTYTIDIFERKGKLYSRSQEYHMERAYTTDELFALLSKNGFVNIKEYPSHEKGRIFFSAIKQ